MFTASELIIEMRDLARLFPDFDYRAQPCTVKWSGCSYVGATVGVKEGKGCIVGQALQRLGVSEEWLSVHEGYPVRDLLGELRVPATDTQERWIKATQNHQDMGQSWENAVSFADKVLGHFEFASSM